MTPTELKQRTNETHFFDRKTMQFFGDSMRNYGVRSTTIRVDYNVNGDYIKGGEEIEAWELYRKLPVKHGLKSSAYFRKDTFSRTFPRAAAVIDIDPVWKKVPMPEHYTCPCGLPVHPSVRNSLDLHIPDCPYSGNEANSRVINQGS